MRVVVQNRVRHHCRAPNLGEENFLKAKTALPCKEISDRALRMIRAYGSREFGECDGASVRLPTEEELPRNLIPERTRVYSPRERPEKCVQEIVDSTSSICIQNARWGYDSGPRLMHLYRCITVIHQLAHDGTAEGTVSLFHSDFLEAWSHYSKWTARLFTFSARSGFVCGALNALILHENSRNCDSGWAEGTGRKVLWVRGRRYPVYD